MEFRDIDKLIGLILVEYDRVCSEWSKAHGGKLPNLKKKLVRDIRADSRIFAYVSGYRAFLSGELHTGQFNIPQVSYRVKAQNSLESKVQRYIDEKEEHGLSPINKCVNDLFGLRIVHAGEVIFEELYEHIESSFGLKCIDASKADYIATHIYFKKDNYSFPWELQVWEESRSKANLISHHKYKQDYASWEREAEGGEK